MVLVATTGTGACSFLLDFPEEGANASTGGGGGDAGGTTGGNGGGDGGSIACFGDDDPAVAEVTWAGKPATANTGNWVSVTGLAYTPEQELLVMYGNASDGVQGYDIPGGQSNQLFLLGRYDTGIFDLILSAWACTFPHASYYAETRRIAPLGEFFVFGGTGNLPTDETGTSSWSISHDGVDRCDTREQLDVTAAESTPGGRVPLLIEAGESSPTLYPLSGFDGALLDYVTDREISGAAWLLGGRGEIDGDAVPDRVYSIAHLDVFNAVEDLAITNLYVDTFMPTRSMPGAVALDVEGTAWFGGSSCAAPDGCDDPQMFFGRYEVDAEAATLLAERPGATSAVTSVRRAGSQLMIGGNYEGTLDALGVSLPESETRAPFVMAFDPQTEQVLWSWPPEGGAPRASEDLWTSVVDVAVSGTEECGAVYVLGCESPQTSGFLDCATFEFGKTTFLMKLDRATGAVLWSESVVLEDPINHLFMPTAIAAHEERLWVAATYFGVADAFGHELESGVSRESVVLQLAP